MRSTRTEILIASSVECGDPVLSVVMTRMEVMTAPAWPVNRLGLR